MEKLIFIRSNGHSVTTVPYSELYTLKDILGFEKITDYYVVANGKIADPINKLIPGTTYNIHSRLRGGKGGFGSMLRAIGAQIEKTTNREACRDLSGRRMRDVNNEKKMLDYLAKKAEKEKEREKKKMEKLERLTQTPKHFFNDPDYEKKVHESIENVDKALEKGLKSHSVKRKVEKKETNAEEPAMKKGLWLGFQDESDSDEDSDDENAEVRITSSNHSQGASSSRACDEDLSTELNPPEESQHNISKDGLSPGHDQIASSSEPEGNGLVESKQEEENVVTDNELENKTISSGEQIDENADKEKQDEELNQVDLSNPSPEPGSSGKLGTESKLAETREMEIKDATVVSCVDLSNFDSASDLEALGLETLKAELMKKGVKCGGTLSERAQRLFKVKDLSPDEIEPALLAKKSKSKKKPKNGNQK